MCIRDRYDRDNEEAFLGSFTVSAPGTGEAIGEPGPLFATNIALDKRFPHGLLLVTRRPPAFSSSRV